MSNKHKYYTINNDSNQKNKITHNKNDNFQKNSI
jgi:hypothetical protein